MRLALHDDKRTWRSTLTRSTGAATNVVGTAEKNPAKASSAFESDLLVLSGVMAYTIFLPIEYPCAGLAPSSAKGRSEITHPERDGEHGRDTHDRRTHATVEAGQRQRSCRRRADEPFHTVTRERLLHHVERSLVLSGRSGLHARLGDVERLACAPASVPGLAPKYRNARDSPHARQLHVPTSTHATPPKPPERKDLMPAFETVALGVGSSACTVS